MGRETTGTWTRYGCLTLLGLGLIAVVVIGVAVGLAAHQNRSVAFERETITSPIEELPWATEASQGSVRLKLEIHTAGATVKPLASGESIRVEADYDPRRYVLRQNSERVGQVVVMTSRSRSRSCSFRSLRPWAASW